MRFGQRSACGSSGLKVSRIPAWVGSLAMIALLSSSLTAQGDSVHGKNTHLVGRVLAGISSLTMGAGVGPQYQTFIFGVESTNGQGERTVTPVEVLYAFFKDQGPLRDSFYDHSKVYELTVERESRCDQSISKLAYELNTDPTRKSLPPTDLLYIPYGAPRSLLETDAVLSCYVLRGPAYRVISEDPDRINSCLVRVPPELQDKPFAAVYEFATKDRKPVNVRKLKNDFLPDKNFISCISQWTVASMSKGVATFTWNPASGWTTTVSPQNLESK